MKRLLVSILALIMLCASTIALAEDAGTITIDATPVWLPDDPLLTALGLVTPAQETQETQEALPVILLRMKKAQKLTVTVLPKSTKNKKVDLIVDDPETVQVKGATLTPLKCGETVLTITSQADPTVAKKFRVVVFQPVTRLTLTTDEKTVAVGKSISLTPVFTPDDAQLKAVYWTSANEKLAIVDTNGTVTGVKKGNVRITATAMDGSNVRANISIKVVQEAETIQLNNAEATVDVGKTVMLKATVLPKETDNKKVTWKSSNESVATVNAKGRVTGVALGDCEIICTSDTNGDVQAKAIVHVQQPVTKLTFGPSPEVYTGETAQLTWTTEPENATNPAVSFKSSNEKILTVDGNGVVTGVKAGKAYVNAVTLDGSNRKAKMQIRILQHVTGVHMKAPVAYIDQGSYSTASAILEPKDASNSNMTWESDDPAIASVKAGKNSSRVNITGVRNGETTVRGTTEDGGFQTSILVKVGSFYYLVAVTDAQYDGKNNILIRVKNVSDNLPITYIKADLEMYDNRHNPVPVNTKDGSNIVHAVYNKQLDPGHSTPENAWTIKDYNKENEIFYLNVRITEFQIDNGWIKVIPENKQLVYEYYPKLK